LQSQEQPLASAIALSDACYKMLYMHVAPYSVGAHGQHSGPVNRLREFIRTVDNMAGGGQIDAVFSGHDHLLQHSIQPVNGEPVHFFVSGAGGKSLYPANPSMPDEEGGIPVAPSDFVSGSAEGKFGFLEVSLTGTSAAYTFRTAQEVIPDIYDWLDGWQFGASQTWFEDKPECTQPLYCVVQGQCTFGTSLGTVANNPIYTPPYHCGTLWSLEVWPGQPVCPNPNSLINARLTVEICYRGPGYCNLASCDIMATAYDCSGNPIWSGCVNFFYSGNGPVFVRDTECIFDRFTLPCRWSIWVQSPDPCWELRAATVEYMCCDNCTPTTGGGGEG
jgi:hypothetical protein